MEKKTIITTGACTGAGTTFISIALAFAMARELDRGEEKGKQKEKQKGIAYLEGQGHAGTHPLPYYELSLDKHLLTRRLVDFFQLKAENKPTDNRVNLYGGVNWAVRGEYSQPELSLAPEEVAGDYVIWDSPWQKLWLDPWATPLPELAQRDPRLILCILDSRPSRIMASRDTVEFLKKHYSHQTLWIFNKATEQKDIKEAEKFLKLKGDFCVPAVSFQDICRAERACLHPGDLAGLAKHGFFDFCDEFCEAINQVASHILTLY